MLYRDRLGAIHELRWWQVLSFSDMPDPSETWNSVGLCAASRAFLTIAVGGDRAVPVREVERRRCHRADSAAWCE